jgi:hypothetical protein
MLIAGMFLLTLGPGCDEVTRTRQPSPYIDPHCPKISNPLFSFRGDIINNKSEATNIGSIIVRQFNKTNGIRSHSTVEIRDSGKSWFVLETDGSGVYGGGVSFEINKCNGAISDFRVDSE